MPKYEYACRSCGEHLEVVQSFTDESLTECPACGGSLRKVFGNIGVVLKGSGFYKTDNRTTSERRKSSDTGDGPKPEKSAGADSKASDPKTADSKAAANTTGDSKSPDSKSSDKSAKSAVTNSKTDTPKTAKSA